MDTSFDVLRLGEKFLPNSNRTKRLLQIGKCWYFLTRENPLPLGPYASEETAFQAICDYAEFAHNSTHEMLERLNAHLAGSTI